LLLEAPVLIDRELNVIEDGCVLIEGDRTAASGPRRQVSARQGAKTIRLKDSILLPGLVNAHCHLDYTAMKDKVPAGGSFAEWVGRMIASKRGWNDSDYRSSIEAGMAEALAYGTTLIANITCVPHLVSSLRLDRAPRIWWFAEELDIGRPPNQDTGHWEEYLKSRFPLQRFSLSPHAPYSVTPEHFARAVHFCHRHGLPWTSHVAESQGEWDMFAHARGPLFELCRTAGRDMADCGGATPFGRVLAWSSGSSAPGLLAHMNCLSKDDFARLGAERARFSVVHCPRSHRFFRHPKFRLKDFWRVGVALALGTDSLASNSSLSMFSEMRTMHEAFPELAPRDILQMATMGGAHALGQSDWTNWADWIAIQGPALANPLEALIKFADRPKFVMVAGKILINCVE
jgi:cytosine/adenosine deaminase-related metal-dependent hydrolase